MTDAEAREWNEMVRNGEYHAGQRGQGCIGRVTVMGVDLEQTYVRRLAET